MLYVITTMITVVASLVSAPIHSEGKPLAEAIEAFNKSATTDKIGKTQTPLTEQEVVAAILMWEPTKDSPVSKELLEQFQSIARTKVLPGNATFEKLTGYDRGGDHVFDVWSVRIRMLRPDDTSYAFLIRERVISSRTIAEELAMLKDLVTVPPNEPRLIAGRLHRRIRDLEKRVAKMER